MGAVAEQQNSVYLEDYRSSRDSADARSEPDALKRLRDDAIGRFESLGLPTMRWEQWRQTDISPITGTRFVHAAGPAAAVAPGQLAPARLPESWSVVVVDGRFAPELSELPGLPDGVRVTGLAQALADDPDRVLAHLHAHVSGFDDNPFVALNTAFARDGVYIEVADQTVLERPVQLLLVSTERSEPMVSYPRNLVVAGSSSELTLVEHYIGLGGGYLCCPMTEVVVGTNASVDHYKFQDEHTGGYHVAGTGSFQERDSRYRFCSVSIGAAIARNDVRTTLNDMGAECVVNGLYLAKDRQVVDHHTWVEHATEHSTSRQLFKGVLDERGRAVFDGLIHVHPGAQKTDSEQTNRNLLLSKRALAHSNPRLRIHADDVKCAHGSTTGHLDEKAVFYLRSRGVDESLARSLLTYAFAREIVEGVTVESLRERVEQRLFEWLPAGEAVRSTL